MAERHGLADFLETELPRLQEQWEGGHYPALIEAFMWCAGNGYRFPDWLEAAVKDEILYSMAHRPRGGTKQGNAVARERMESTHLVRFRLVEQNLKFQQLDLDAGRRTAPVSEAEAARDAQEFLSRPGHAHPARGSSLAILKSYRRLKSG